MKAFLIIVLLFCSSFGYAGDYDCEDGSFLPEESVDLQYDHSIGEWTFENVAPQFSPEDGKDTITFPELEPAPQCNACEDPSDEMHGDVNDSNVE